MPRKPKHKKQQDDDELDHKAPVSKWASVLNQPDSDQEQLAPVKKTFDFDFSQQHRLYNEQSKPQKQEPKIILSPEEQQKLDLLLEKQRREKEEKERIKREKRHQKKKLIEKQKSQQKMKKEEQIQEQKQLEHIVRKNKQNSDSKKIILTMLFVLVMLGVLNYNKDIYSRISKFRINKTADFYEVLEISPSSTDNQLKSQYKKLVMKYHPDKNPNCHSCTEKFNSIMEAWEVLGTPEKRKVYDHNLGFVVQIPSETVTLTPDNYQQLLGDSDNIWLVQVYDSTNQYCHYFASQWQKFAAKSKGFISTGRIDIWQQTDMKSYIPYKFQLFPGIYIMHRGQDRLCQFDFERPYRSMELCIDQQLQETAKVTKIADWSQIPDEAQKVAVILGSNVKLSYQLKLIHSKLSRYISFYQMTNDNSNLVQQKGKDHKFTNFTQTPTKTTVPQYRQFLQGIIRQQKTQCQILMQCKQKPCLLLLDQTYVQDQVLPYPLIDVKDQKYLLEQVQRIKNVTGLNQKFQVGYYQDGKIELGYFSQLAHLTLQQGENGEAIELNCQERTILTTLMELYESLFG